MKMPITKEYLDSLRCSLMEAEEDGIPDRARQIRDEYRQACAAAYSSGDLVFKTETAALPPERT